MTALPPPKPSPLPWGFEECHGHIYLTDATGKKIASMLGTQAVKTDNAALILEAINKDGGQGPAPQTMED